MIPPLKHLNIGNFSVLETTGYESYKNHDSSWKALFASLEYQEFHATSCWHWWSPCLRPSLFTNTLPTFLVFFYLLCISNCSPANIIFGVLYTCIIAILEIMDCRKLEFKCSSKNVLLKSLSIINSFGTFRFS